MGVTMRLGQLVKQRKRKVAPTSLPQAAFIGMDCIEPGALSPGFLYKFGDFKSAGNHFCEGDVLYGRLRPYLNKVCSPGFDGVASGEFLVLAPDDFIETKYLLYGLHSAQFVDFASRKVSGDRPRIRFDEICEFELPVYSPPEQRAIVAKIEQLFSELDAGIASLKNAQEQLKVYRHAVLKKAFEGELTKEWRKQNVISSPIDSLLRQLENARVNDAKIKGKKLKIVKPITNADCSMLPTLPLNWRYQRLNDITLLITDGKHGDCRNQENSGYYFVSAKDISNGKINYGQARQILKADFEEVHKRTDLQPEDVVVTNAGTIGRIAIATAEENTSRTTFQKSVAIIKKPNSLIDSKYLAYQLENDVEQIKLASKGTAQKNLLLGTMSELVMSICCIDEQHQIVQEIETRLSVCDNVEANIKEALFKAKALRQSILKKAFEGKLLSDRELQEVRSAPDWEPAEKLLARIQAEKAPTNRISGSLASCL